MGLASGFRVGARGSPRRRRAPWRARGSRRQPAVAVGVDPRSPARSRFRRVAPRPGTSVPPGTREPGEGHDGDRRARPPAVARVRLLGGARYGTEAEVHAVAGSDHRERVVVALQRHLLRALVDAERRQQAERDQRRHLRAERPAQLLEARANARFRGAERQVQLGRDLLVREVVEEGEAERLALGRRELLERRPDDGAAGYRDAASGGPGSRAGSPSRTRPSGLGTMSGWRLRRRSSFRTRKCAI